MKTISLPKCRLLEFFSLQAADTDISALVEIEKNSPHRFEFFMGLGGDQPICARTAWAYGKTGGRISHALSVYSCQFRQPNQVSTSGNSTLYLCGTKWKGY